MELKEAKEKIRLESANPDTNRYFQTMIQDSEDCFGRAFKEDNQECKGCTILSSLGNRREPVYVFCKELAEEANTSKEEIVVTPPAPGFGGEWKVMVKSLYLEGLPKEEIVAKVTATYPIPAGKIGAVINGMRFQKAGVKARQEKAQTPV